MAFYAQHWKIELLLMSVVNIVSKLTHRADDVLRRPMFFSRGRFQPSWPWAAANPVFISCTMLDEDTGLWPCGGANVHGSLETRHETSDRIGILATTTNFGQNINRNVNKTHMVCKCMVTVLWKPRGGIAWCFELEIPTMTKYGQNRQPGATSLHVLHPWIKNNKLTIETHQFRFTGVKFK
jgi:hypothetical protein